MPRLQCGALVSWLAGAVIVGLFFGGLGQAMSDAIDPSNPYAKVFVGDSATVLQGVMGLLVLFNGLLAGAFAVQRLAGARAEEASGRLDSQLSGALSRSAWLFAQVLVAGAGSAAILLLGGWLMGASSQGRPRAASLRRRRSRIGRPCC